MKIDDWTWLLESTQANERGVDVLKLDVGRLRALAAECSLSASEVKQVLDSSGPAGLLVSSTGECARATACSKRPLRAWSTPMPSPEAA